MTLGTEAAGGTQQSVRQLTNIFRRVYRIFAHAWFQHRQVFWQVEGNEGLYILFKKVCDVYNLIQEDNYTISPEAEGIASNKEDEPESGIAILKKQADEEETNRGDDDTTTTTISTGATTRRHKHTPSTGSLVPTIAEGDEDDNHDQAPVKTKDTSTDASSNSAPRAPPQMDPPETKTQVPLITATAAPELEPEPSKETDVAGEPTAEPALDENSEHVTKETDSELSALNKDPVTGEEIAAESRHGEDRDRGE